MYLDAFGHFPVRAGPTVGGGVCAFTLTAPCIALVVAAVSLFF